MGEIFESEPWVVPKRFLKWWKFEEPKYFKVRTEVGEAAPHYPCKEAHPPPRDRRDQRLPTDRTVRSGRKTVALYHRQLVEPCHSAIDILDSMALLQNVKPVCDSLEIREFKRHQEVVDIRLVDRF